MRAGANMVKLEGGAWLAETVKMLAERAVILMAAWLGQARLIDNQIVTLGQ